jgi:hypothetical protein
MALQHPKVRLQGSTDLAICGSHGHGARLSRANRAVTVQHCLVPQDTFSDLPDRTRVIDAPVAKRDREHRALVAAPGMPRIDIRPRPLSFNPRSLPTAPFDATACVVGLPPATAMSRPPIRRS